MTSYISTWFNFPNIKPLKLLHRRHINDQAWNECVAASDHRMIYGLAWYLDAVSSAPGWKWVGLVLPDEKGTYQAVMPVPLRRKYGQWVVHQPLFCQFFHIYAQSPTIDTSLFFRVMQQRFWYGSILHLQQLPSHQLAKTLSRSLSTWLLNLAAPYETIHQQYSPDRQRNLRKANAFGWSINASIDPEPMLSLFRQYHSGAIPGGVGEWAYDVFRRLLVALQQHQMATLYYAVWQGNIEAGALFVQEGNRVIYLFNAASDLGRTGNARTLLIDQLIQERCGQPGLWFDFESPEKESVVAFYRSFGAIDEFFWSVRWNRFAW